MNDPNRTPDEHQPEPPTVSFTPPGAAPPGPRPDNLPSSGVNALNLFHEINDPAPDADQLAPKRPSNCGAI